MIFDEVYIYKLYNFKQALMSFEKLPGQDLRLVDNVISDGLKNGQVQKFEYCAEMCWKMIKRFLLVMDGVDARTPKGAVKEFYSAAYISEGDYEILAGMLDDRNRLGHIYKEDYFNEILSRLPGYLEMMKKVAGIIMPEK